MTREFRIRYSPSGWSAELRFDATDEELRAANIAPGWHSFKRSIAREIVDRAAMLAYTQAPEPKRFLK